MAPKPSRRLPRRLVIVAALLVMALIAWAACERYFAPTSNTSLSRFDAIIVLGVPSDDDGNPTPSQLARVTEAVQEYDRGVAPRLILTGGAAHNRFVEARVMARAAEAQGVPESAILVEGESNDTIHNACYSARIMKAHGWRSAEVIAAAVHLPRAGLIFSRLPVALPTGQDLRTYFTQVGVTNQRQNVRRFDTLDDALRWVEDQILAEHLQSRETGEAPLALSQFELLQDIETDQIPAFLAQCVVERSCAPGELIFQVGGTADELYLIRRGLVRIILPVGNSDYHNLASIAPGDFFGEGAFLDRGRRSANAMASTAVDLFVISRADFDEVSRSRPEVAAKILGQLARTLALRLRHADAELRARYEA